MIVYDIATKVLDRESFPQHAIADLSSGITFIVLFSQEKPLWWKEINTHTEETIIDAHVYNCPKYPLNNTIYDFTSFPFIKNVICFSVSLFIRSKYILASTF